MTDFQEFSDAAVKIRERFVQAEQYVCGCILIDEKTLPEIVSAVGQDDFLLDEDKTILRCAISLDGRGEPVDPATILNEARGALKSDYLKQVMDITPTTANLPVHLRIVRNGVTFRKLAEVGKNLQASAMMAESPSEALDEAVQALEKIRERESGIKILSSEEAIMAFYKYREELERGGGKAPTGIFRLDNMLGGGFLNGGLYLLAARPAMGKTTFAISIAEYAAQAAGPVLFFTLEMTEVQITAKRMARESGASSSDLLLDVGKKAEKALGLVVNTNPALAKRPLYVCQKEAPSIAEIAAASKRVKGLRMIVIDYFGFIEKPKSGRSLYENATELSGQLKALAKRLNIPVLCLAQLNRENMSQRDKRPNLSNLRDTGALEQDADGVLFLHREGYYDPDKEEGNQSETEVILAKNRHGATGSVKMVFYKDCGRFLEVRGSYDG